MSERSTITVLAEAFGQAFEKLGAALSSDAAFSAMLLELGWEADSIPAPLAALSRPIADLRDALGDGTVTVDDLDDVLGAIRALAEAIADLENHGASMPASLTVDGFDTAIATQLLDHLLLDHLDEHYPLFVSALTALGVARTSELDDESNRPGSIQHTIAWDALPVLLSDPRQLLVDAYDWGSDEFDHGLLMELVADIADSLGLPVYFEEPHEAVREVLDGGHAKWSGLTANAVRLPLLEDAALEAGIDLYPLPASGTRKPGLAILPYASGPLTGSMPVTENFALDIESDLDLTDGVAILIRPDERLELQSGIVSGGSPATVGSLRAVLRYVGDTLAPRLLLGASAGTRLQATGMSVVADVAFDADGASELSLEIAAEGAQLVLDAGSADAFIGKLVGDVSHTIDVDLGAGISTVRGFYLGAGSDLEITLPLEIRAGPITLSDVRIALDPGDDGVAVVVTAAVAGELGPLAAAVDSIGLAGELRPAASAGGNLGPMDAILEFQPPARVTVTVESEAIDGGGFIDRDPAIERYAGGVDLEIFGTGISGLVIVDTQVPATSGGWALFGSLGATFTSPIPIGFGFTLNGVGGLLALNRTIDVDALAGALRTGAADSILFPDDIEADAEAVLSGIDQWFPIQPDTLVVGPVVELGWGSPNLVTAELGVMVALPDLIVTLLGSLEMLLPTADDPLLSLRMDVLGAIDVPAATVTVAASLHDSNLLDVFELSGDMGFYARLAGQPLFVLSIGGYHPQFDPPGALPGWLIDLRRTRAAVDLGDAVEIVLDSYVALTSNTLQFGGKYQVVASVKVLLTTYTADGWFGVNVLLVLKPFKLVAGATAGVTISANDKEIFSVQLSANLQGPEPWYANGIASFTFFGLDVDFGFDIGSRPGGEPREIHDVAADVLAAMSSADSLLAIDVADSWAGGVVTAPQRPEGLWVRPDQSVRLGQSVAPLNRSISAYGEFTPATDRIDATGVTVGADPVDAPVWLEDWFAPAQFDRLGDSARLSTPSYELMTAGVTFGDDGIAISDDEGFECTSVSRAPEESIDPDNRLVASRYVSPADASTRVGHRRSIAGEPIEVRPTTYTVVRTETGERAGAVLAGAAARGRLSYADAIGVLDARAADKPSDRSRLRAVPSHAAVSEAAA